MQESAGSQALKTQAQDPLYERLPCASFVTASRRNGSSEAWDCKSVLRQLNCVYAFRC
jgi:hypothetical protein